MYRVSSIPVRTVCEINTDFLHSSLDPVHRSYHLGGMDRYEDTRVAMHTSLPYRPSGSARRDHRADDLRSDHTEAHGRFA